MGGWADLLMGCAVFKFSRPIRLNSVVFKNLRERGSEREGETEVEKAKWRDRKREMEKESEGKEFPRRGESDRCDSRPLHRDSPQPRSRGSE